MAVLIIDIKELHLMSLTFLHRKDIRRMDKPIRILQVIGVMNRGGAETMIMNLYRNIDRTKVQFDFVVHTNEVGSFDEEIKTLGGRIYHCPRYVIKNHIGYKKWWKKFLSEHSQDYIAVHGHIGSTASIYLSISNSYGLYTIAHSHNASGISTLKDVVYKLLSYNTRNVAKCFFACSQLAGIKRYGRQIVCNNKIFFVLNNAIDTEKYICNDCIKNKKDKELCIDESQTVLGHVGRFDHQKNHQFIIDVFYEYKKNVPSAVLILVGDGDLKNEILEKTNKMNIDDSVIFTGVRSDIPELLNAFDLFIMPSFYEGLPVSVIEAQASGLKCLLSDTITKEVDITGNVEFMSLEKSPKEWAEKIVSMLPYERKNTQQKIIDAGYDIKSTAEWLTDFYLKISENK